MKVSLQSEWFLILLLALLVGGTIAVLPLLPDPMPIHWNALGEPDNYAGRTIGALMLPLTTVGLYLLFLLIPAIDPRRENYERFADTYRIFRLVLILFMAFIHGATLYSVIGGDSRLNPDLVIVAVGLLFVLLGNYMPRIRSNWFVGIRTPWTLSSAEVWRRTHRFGGRAFFLAGLLLILSALLPAASMLPALLAAILLAAAAPIAYSYWVYRKIKREDGG